jgi:hypothetical protein
MNIIELVTVRRHTKIGYVVEPKSHIDKVLTPDEISPSSFRVEAS